MDAFFVCTSANRGKGNGQFANFTRLLEDQAFREGTKPGIAPGLENNARLGDPTLMTRIHT